MTTDELSAVSGGSMDGQDDPYNYRGNDNANDSCAKIKNTRTRDRCYLETARSQNCPGGWSETTEGGSAGKDGIQGRSTTVECKTGNSNDDGSNDGDGDSNGGNGNDS